MAFFRLYIITTMTTEKTPNENLVFMCKICEFSSHKYSDFERHMSTNKHTINSNSLNIVNKRVLHYKCDCGKRFNHRATLYNHMKGCDGKEKIILSNIKQNTVMDILTELVSQNAEFKRELVSQNAEF